MDHVGGLERLFYQIYFDEAWRGSVRLYAHAALVPLLQARVADYPEVLAEGGANFWDAFRLIPLSRGFWCDGLWFDVFATRHHAPHTSFGIALRRQCGLDRRYAAGSGDARRARRAGESWSRTIARWSAIRRTPASTISIANTRPTCAAA